jgi:hypothetical protein|tara:strand:+ start:351 stop:722 length:372 start_codon:yes stop_codon:yes gene_type:complete
MNNAIRELDISIACMLDEPTKITIKDLEHIQKQVDLLVVEEENKKNQIDITWCVDDIRFLGYECTDEEGMKVLKLVEEDHDCEYGINWATLDNACESFNLKLKSDDNIHKVNDDFIRKEVDHG